jgi:hypothetical protein
MKDGVDKSEKTSKPAKTASTRHPNGEPKAEKDPNDLHTLQSISDRKLIKEKPL